jgi:hypothetical protein
LTGTFKSNKSSSNLIGRSSKELKTDFKNDFSSLKPEAPVINLTGLNRYPNRPKLNTVQSEVHAGGPLTENVFTGMSSLPNGSTPHTPNLDVESNKFSNRRRRSLSQDANRPVSENQVSERNKNQLLSRSQSQKPDQIEEQLSTQSTSDLLNQPTSGNFGSNLDINFVDQLSNSLNPSIQGSMNELTDDGRYCKVEWFDHTQKILKVTPLIKTIYQALSVLADQAKVDPAALDCFFINDSRPLATENQIEAIVGREIRVERRSIFRLDLIKVKRSVGIRAKWNKTIKDALESVLQKYDLQVNSAELKIAGQNSSYFQGDLPAFNTIITDFSQAVAILDGLRVIVSEKSENRNYQAEIKDCNSSFGKISMNLNNNNNNNNNRRNRSRHGSRGSMNGITNVSMNGSLNGSMNGSVISGINSGANGNMNASITGSINGINISRNGSYCGSYSDVHSNRNSIQTYINQRPNPRGSIDDDTAALMNACDLANDKRLDSQRGLLKKEDLELPDFLKPRRESIKIRPVSFHENEPDNLHQSQNRMHTKSTLSLSSNTTSSNQSSSTASGSTNNITLTKTPTRLQTEINQNKIDTKCSSVTDSDEIEEAIEAQVDGEIEGRFEDLIEDSELIDSNIQ